MDTAAFGMALVVDDGGRLLGTLSDGDVRRAILNGAELECPVEEHANRDYTWVPPGLGRADVLDLMQARTFRQIPILDSARRLVGVHLLHEILGQVERPNIAVVMAGGLGTRLRPITERLPKPMLKVAGRPILERLVLHLVGFGIRRIFISVHYLGKVIEDHFGNGDRFGCRVEYLREETPLGTGGCLSLLPVRPEEPFLVMNGDLVTQVDIDGLLRHHAVGNYAATMGVQRYAHQIPFGCVDVEDGRLTRLEEKPVIERMVNAGIYVLSPEIVARVPRETYPITDLFGECLARGETVGVYPVDDDWLDVGQHESLRRAREGKG
jgi:dTDP-glucose pyrophosphorylase